MIVLIDYASPSMIESSRDTATLGIATNARRPVQFCGKVVEQNFLLRFALRALGEAIWSNDTWLSQQDILDPVITVHPDRLFFEAFSQDQSAYVSLIVDRSIFRCEEEVITGTTNIDFTAWLWGALGELRSSRETTFRVGAGGMEVVTATAGGRFEKKVDLPDSWVRGFLQVQAAMAMPGTRLEVKPIDLLSAIRFLRYTKAKVSPRALRYEFTPGADAQLILEPWEKLIPLEGASHNYTEKKTTRVWGRRRLNLIEGLLPFADSVEIYLKGRALPSFYAVNLPGMTFVLGLTGWSGSAFTDTGSFDLLTAHAAADDANLLPALEQLRQRYHVSLRELADTLGIDQAACLRVLMRLCRRGQCMFDVQRREYRHRELFEEAADEALHFPPDLRQELAKKMLDANQVSITLCETQETTKIVALKSPEGRMTREVTRRDWRVLGTAGEARSVEIVIGDSGSIIFGRCSCNFFEEHLLNRGPCEHMLAVFQASEKVRLDRATSRPVDEAVWNMAHKSRRNIDEDASEEDAEEEDEEQDEEQ